MHEPELLDPVHRDRAVSPQCEAAEVGRVRAQPPHDCVVDACSVHGSIRSHSLATLQAIEHAKAVPQCHTHTRTHACVCCYG